MTWLVAAAVPIVMALDELLGRHERLAVLRGVFSEVGPGSYLTHLWILPGVVIALAATAWPRPPSCGRSVAVLGVLRLVDTGRRALVLRAAR